jgi:hypothetical protein
MNGFSKFQVLIDKLRLKSRVVAVRPHPDGRITIKNQRAPRRTHPFNTPRYFLLRFA